MSEIPDDIRKVAEDIAKQMPALIDGCDCPGCMESAEFIVAEALQADRERTTALKAEMDKLWSMFVVQCESIEDRDNGPGENEHAKGFLAGERYAAKSIRRSVDHPKYNKADFPAYNGEGA